MEEQEVDTRPIAGIGTKVFGKWDASEVTCSDPGLAPYVNLTTVGVPHTGGRHANSWFGKSKLSVVERYINKLMRTGAYTGKKQSAMKAFEQALDKIADQTGENPLQTFVDAIIHAAPREKLRTLNSVQLHNLKQSTPHHQEDSTLHLEILQRVHNRALTNPREH